MTTGKTGIAIAVAIALSVVWTKQTFIGDARWWNVATARLLLAALLL